MLRYIYYCLLLTIVTIPSFAPAEPARSCNYMKENLDYYMETADHGTADNYLPMLADLIRTCRYEANQGNNKSDTILRDTLIYFYTHIYPQLVIDNAAFDFIKSQADMGDKQAALHLSHYYKHGIVVNQDIDESFSILKNTMESIEKENSSLQLIPHYTYYAHGLALHYMEGNGTAKDYSKSLKWLTVGSDNDYTPSMRLLALHYINGWGIKKDNLKTFDFMHKAATLGDLNAMYFLATMYNSGINAYRDPDPKAGTIKIDHNQAFKWMLRAAIRGLPKAQYGVAHYYIEGIGVKKDLEIAIEWIQQAALNGHKLAQEFLNDDENGDV